VRHAFEEGADVVIAITADKDIYLTTELLTAMDVYLRAGQIQSFHLKKYDLEGADLVIRPDLGNIHWTDFSQYKRLISLGESAALKRLPEIKRISETTVQRSFTDGIKRVIERLFATQPSQNG